MCAFSVLYPRNPVTIRPIRDSSVGVMFARASLGMKSLSSTQATATRWRTWDTRGSTSVAAVLAHPKQAASRSERTDGNLPHCRSRVWLHPEERPRRSCNRSSIHDVGPQGYRVARQRLRPFPRTAPVPRTVPRHLRRRCSRQGHRGILPRRVTRYERSRRCEASAAGVCPPASLQRRRESKSLYQDESQLSGRTTARPPLRARLSRPCRCHSRGQAERILNSGQGLQCRVARGFGIRRRPDGATEGFGLRDSPAFGHFLE